MGREHRSSRHKSEGGHRHHRRKSPWRIFKHNVKKKLTKHKWLGPVVLVSLALIAGVGFWMMQSVQSTNARNITAGNQVYQGSGYRDITYKGREYRYNNRITTILYAGVDSEGELTALNKYGIAPRADSISLVVLDEYHKRMTVIALSRDTMTEIHKYAMDGWDRGLFRDHLGYAYTFGDGGEASCKNLCQAVSDLLYDVPIKDYVIANRSSLPTISDIIGGVQVTVPNDDLAEYGFRKGEVVTIDGTNLEQFVRSRDTAKDLSNVGRMERQQAYISGAIVQIQSMLTKRSSEIWRQLEAAEACFQTNITRSRYLDLVDAVNNTVYNDQNYYIPEGSQVVGDQHDEFYPDEEKLLEKIVEIFYIEK